MATLIAEADHALRPASTPKPDVPCSNRGYSPEGLADDG
jgi:hypothetical protein